MINCPLVNFFLLKFILNLSQNIIILENYDLVIGAAILKNIVMWLFA